MEGSNSLEDERSSLGEQNELDHAIQVFVWCHVGRLAEFTHALQSDLTSAGVNVVRGWFVQVLLRFVSQ